MDTPLLRWVEGEERVSNREDGGQRDEWMNGGVTFVAIFGGSLFFTCSDRERGRNADKMAQRKNKLKSNKLRGEHKVQTERNPQGVCVLCVCCGQEWTNQRRETHKFLLQRTGDTVSQHRTWIIRSVS